MGLFRTAARASVATRVVGNTHRRQRQRWAAEDVPPSPGPATEAAQPSLAPQASDIVTQLTQLGQLRDQGILTQQEFEAQKQRLLN